MGSSFNPQILVDKLAKLNSSQASIETLSHWCIFHMNKAKYVVETWDRQFHCSPREQRLAFLYLANDILQNSRRKGSEFVAEFWKVLPDALRYVVEHGDEFGRNAALRLISIWEERKVFGSRGQILKEELIGRHLDNSNRNGRHKNVKLKQPGGNTLDKIVSSYHLLYGGQIDEDALLSKCRNAVGCIEKVDKELNSDVNSGQFHGSALVEELQGHHATLRECIEQLRAVESSRANLVLQLREALHEQEFKLEQVRSQLQAAQSQSEQADDICRRLLNCDNTHLTSEKSSKESRTSKAAPQSFVPVDSEQTAPVMYAPQVSFSEKSGHVEEDPRKSAAAAVAAKLTASTSSAQMLSYVLSSLASEGVICNPLKENAGEYPVEKRPKLENDQPYIPPQNPQKPAVSSFSHAETQQYGVTSTSQQLTTNEVPPPPPSSSPPPLPPLPAVPPYSVSQYIPAAGSINGGPYSYSMTQQQLPSPPGYPVAGAPMTGISPFTTLPANSYQTFQGSEGFYNQQPSTPTAPVSRQ